MRSRISTKKLGSKILSIKVLGFGKQKKIIKKCNIYKQYERRQYIKNTVINSTVCIFCKRGQYCLLPPPPSDNGTQNDGISIKSLHDG